MGNGSSCHHRGEGNDDGHQGNQAAQEQGKGFGPRTVGIIGTIALLILPRPVQIRTGGWATGEPGGNGMGLGFSGNVIHGDVGGAGTRTTTDRSKDVDQFWHLQRSPGRTGQPWPAPPSQAAGRAPC